ncbi:MAG: hypothetical protein ABSE62_00415 [Chthoniobacteraceae bacterium]|jgi:hypothetical protein
MDAQIRPKTQAEIRQECEVCADWKPSFELTALCHRPKGLRGPAAAAAAIICIALTARCERILLSFFSLN